MQAKMSRLVKEIIGAGYGRELVDAVRRNHRQATLFIWQGKAYSIGRKQTEAALKGQDAPKG